MAKAHPENAPGDFYVEDGCCISCGIPMSEAPEIFDWAKDEFHCVVKRQPESQADMDAVIRAMRSAEIDCIRYCGRDPALKRRIAEAGHGDNCDEPVTDARVIIRDRVTFASPLPDDNAETLAARLRAWLARLDNPWMKVKPARSWSRAAAVFTWTNFSWERSLFRRPDYHRVDFQAAGSQRFLARLRPGHPRAGIGLAMTIHDWLAEGEGAASIQWYAPDEDPAAGPGLYMPV